MQNQEVQSHTSKHARDSKQPIGKREYQKGLKREAWE